MIADEDIVSKDIILDKMFSSPTQVLPKHTMVVIRLEILEGNIHAHVQMTQL